MYGSHMAERHVIESNMLASTQRPGGHKSNMFGLNGHLNRYDEFTFADFLNDPNEDPNPDKIGMHSRMEKVYGL